jgi:hypothetical protein
MNPVRRTLLIINRNSGTGHCSKITDRLQSLLNSYMSRQASLQVEVVDNHTSVSTCSREFFEASQESAAIIAALASPHTINFEDQVVQEEYIEEEEYTDLQEFLDLQELFYLQPLRGSNY